MLTNIFKARKTKIMKKNLISPVTPPHPATLF